MKEDFQNSLLEIAHSDIQASRKLFEARLYPQSVYFFAQSVEKVMKYFGLLVDAITVEDCRKKIGHKSYKVFDQLIKLRVSRSEELIDRKEIVKKLFGEQVQGMLNVSLEEEKKIIADRAKVDYSSFEYLNGWDLNRMIKYASSSKNSDFHADEEEIRAKLPEIIEKIGGQLSKDFTRMTSKEYGVFESVMIEYLRLMKHSLTTSEEIVAIYSQLSHIFFPHDQDSRYPCGECGENPKQFYNSKLPLIKKYTELYDLHIKGLKLCRELQGVGNNELIE